MNKLVQYYVWYMAPGITTSNLKFWVFLGEYNLSNKIIITK